MEDRRSASRFFKEFVSRNGEGSSKKLWYNGACAVASVIMVYLAWTLPTERGIDDSIFVWLFAVYLGTVGGFDVILEIMRLFIQLKTGSAPVDTPKVTPTQSPDAVKPQASK